MSCKAIVFIFRDTSFVKSHQSVEKNFRLFQIYYTTKCALNVKWVSKSSCTHEIHVSLRRAQTRIIEQRNGWRKHFSSIDLFYCSPLESRNYREYHRRALRRITEAPHPLTTALPFITAHICMRMYSPIRKRIKLEFTVRLAGSRDAAGLR